MDSKIVNDERRHFSDRLMAALIAAHQPTTISAFTRAFNLRADGASVSVHGARKWLQGEAFPTQEKILILARWLNANASWLRFGDAENGQYHPDAVPPPRDLSAEDLVLIHDVMSLPPAAQLIVRDLVDSFLRHDGVLNLPQMQKNRS